MQFPRAHRKISFIAQLFGLFMLLLEVRNKEYTKKRRTIDFLRGASMNLKLDDISNSTALFPSIDSQVCMIAKNGHSAILYVSCLLAAKQMSDSRAEDFLLSRSTFSGAFTHVCENLRPVWAKENEHSNKIVFIRDPLERFASGWLFVCKRHKVCLDCGSDLSCFLTTMLNCWNTNMQYSKACTFTPPSVPRNFIFLHMSPQAVYCKLWDKSVLKNYTVIKYERAAVNEFLMRAANPVLSQKQYEHLTRLLSEPSDHASLREDVAKLKAKISLNMDMAVTFSKLYFIDYDTFSIGLPEFMINIDFRFPLY